MAEEKKNGRIHLSTILAIVGILGGPLLVWGDAQRKDGQVTEKLSTLEKRQHEDRMDTRQNINEVKEHVKQIDRATQEILQTIRAMEAVQKAEWRRESR